MTTMLLIGVLGHLLGAGAAWHAAPADACALLSTDDVRSVQQTTVKECKSSVHTARGLRYEQCVFAAADFAHSVSLTVISGDADATRAFWTSTFRPQRTEASLVKATRKKELPRQITNLGDDAFWTGDTRTGALYVLTGDRVLRISVGGASEEPERLRRSRALADAALARLTAAQE
jgi:hypothetical protein